MKIKLFRVFLAAASVFVLGGVVARADAPDGFTAVALAKGRLAQPTEIGGAIEFSTSGATDVITQRGEFVAGGITGWHMHPGLTVVTVKSGTVTNHSGCHVTVLSAGQTFVEPPFTPILVTSPTGAVVFATLVVPAGTPARIEVTPPDCSDEQESN
jgi:quercetin dioxygenase-like cupin family protein